MRYLKKTCAITLSMVMILGLAAGNGTISNAAGNVEKEETVYVTQDSDGNVKEVTVSDWLKNVSGTGEISDVSNLKDIKNVKGNEAFTQENNGKLVWKADNTDIYYQGTTDKKLPVGVKISYQLDGKEVKPEDMADRSGKLTMTIKYENNAVFEEEIDGEKAKLNTPFLMASALILPVDTFANVTVSQGRIVSEGTNQILVVYGMPGLSESLNLSEDMKKEMDKKLSDTVTITADVTDFSMGSIYTVAASDEFSDIELDDDSDINDVENAINDLADATNKLLTGSEDLSDGLTELQSNFKTYASGMKEVSNGASDLFSGADKLAQGVSKYTKGVKKLTKGTGQFVAGTTDFAKGVNGYVDGEKKIDAGITELYNSTQTFPASYSKFSEGLLSYIDNVNAILNQENTEKLAQGSTRVAGGITQINQNLQQVSSGFSNYDTALQLLSSVQNDPAYADLDEASKEALANAIVLISGTKSAQAEGVNGLIAATNADSEISKGANQIAGTMKQLNEEGAPALASGGQQLKAGSQEVSKGITGVNGGVKSLYDGIKTLSSNNEQLEKAAAELTTKGLDLTAGTITLNENTSTLTDSAKTLSGGAGKLELGAGKLKKATNEINNGVNRLQKGSVDLLDGMRTFKKSGTEKIRAEYNDNIKTVIDRFKVITKGADEYKSFSGIAEDMDGTVKFIFQTSEISSES